MSTPPQFVSSLPTAAPESSRAPGQPNDHADVADSSSSEHSPPLTNSQLNLAIKLSQNPHEFLWKPHYKLSDGPSGIEEALIARSVIGRLKKIEKTLWGDPKLSDLLNTVIKYKERGKFVGAYPDENGENLFQINQEYELILSDFNALGTHKGKREILVGLRMRHVECEDKAKKASKSFKNATTSTMRSLILGRFRNTSPHSESGESQTTSGTSPPPSDSNGRHSSSSTSSASNTPLPSTTDKTFLDGSHWQPLASRSSDSDPSSSTSSAPGHPGYAPLASQHDEDTETLNGDESGSHPDGVDSFSGPAQEETYPNDIDATGTEYFTPRSFCSLQLPVNLPLEDLESDSDANSEQINDGHAYASVHPQETSLELTQNGESSEDAGGETATYIQHWLAGVDTTMNGGQ